MSSLIQKSTSYFFSSAESLGAVNKDRNGSRFQIPMQNILVVPQTAVDVTLEVTSANIWFTSPNISPEWKNNHLYLSYRPVYPLFSGAEVDVDITIPTGLYGISQLNDTISELIQTFSSGGTRFASDSVVLTADSATQRVKLHLGAHFIFVSQESAT